MYRVAVLLMICLIPVAAFAQEETKVEKKGWKYKLDISIGQSQSAYSGNWDGDEEGTMTWISTLTASAEKQLSELLNSRTTLKLEYGQTQTQSRETDNWSGPQKSSDLIDIESVLKMTYSGWVDPYVAFRIESLFTDDRYDPVKLFNPMTLTESAGIAKTLLKNEQQECITRLGFAIHQRMDRYSPSSTGRGTESKTITDAGLEWVTELETPLYKDNIKMSSKLIVFQAVHNSDASDLEGQVNEKYWKTTDFDLETNLKANITKLIMVNVKMRWLYDKEIDKAGRFKELMSLGLTYSFF